MNVGTKVAVLRNKLNINRNKLGKMVDLEYQTIWRIEADQTGISYITAYKLSRVFGITIDELLNDDIDCIA